MTPSHDLFLLIKNLSGAEKRYFKVWAQRHVIGEKNKYEQLFDLIDALPDHEPYNETNLKQQLTDEQMLKNFADEKKNLHELVMKAMRSFYHDKTIDHQIDNLLLDEEFYRQKRLNNLRQKAIDKGKKLAVKYDKLPALLTLIEREMTLQIEWQQDELKTLSDRINLQEQQALNQLQILASLRYFSNRLFIQVRISTAQSSELLRKESSRILQEPIVKNYQPGNNFHADRHYYRIHAMHHRIHRHMDQHQHYTKLVFELYDIHFPHQQQNSPSSYKISLFNYLNACFAAGDLKPFPALLKKARAIPATNRDEEGEDWQNLIHLELIYLSNMGLLNQATQMATDIETGLKKYAHKVNMARQLAICYNLAAAFFVSGQWNRALDYYLKILQDKTDARQDLKTNSELLQLAIQYELKNYDLAEYQLRNIERRFAKQPDKEDYKLFFKYLRQLIKDPAATHSPDQEKLNASLARQAELLCWVQAKQQKKKIEEVFRQTTLTAL
ncbi:MAG: hypothetical protein U0T74_08625 [Chitinophagales bacterium]